MHDIIQLKKGDVSVFNKVYSDYHKRLYYYLLKKTGSSFYAEEITQVAFIKLWKYRESLNEEISLDAQIFRVAKTAFIDQMRQIAGKKKMTAAFFGKIQKEEVLNEGIEKINEKEVLSKLQKVLSGLTPTQKKVFEMSRLYELNYKEIAVLQSTSVKTVENHINQALKKIKTSFLLLVLSLFI